MKGAASEMKEGLKFAKSTYSKVKTKLMTAPDRTEGGKYRIERVGNQLYKVPNKKK